MKAYALLIAFVAPLAAALGQPVITTQPVTQTVAAGSPANFTVTATGTAPLSYQWRRGGTALTGATAAALTLPAVAAADAGTYDVVVTNAVSSVTSTGALLNVTGATSGDFVYSSDGSAATVTGYTGAGGALSLPSAIAGIPVVAIADQAFRGKTTITSVSIPGSVRTIGTYAFMGCTSLATVTLNEGLITLGALAFQQCTALSQVTIPASVTSIQTAPFIGCDNLSTITVDPANSAYAADASGLYDKARTTLIQVPGRAAGAYIIPSTVTTIGGSAFQFCKLVTEVSVPAGVTVLPANAFYRCTALTRVNLPNTLTLIGYQAFLGCSSLESLTLPEGLQTIEASAFRSCTNLTTLRIPANVTSISNSFVFDGASNLTAIEVAAANPSFSSIDGVLFNKAATTLLQYPEKKAGAAYAVPATVTTLGDYAFARASVLTSITLPAGLTTISPNAFRYAGQLSALVLPASLTTVGNSAFADALHLRDVAFLGDAPSAGTGLFTGSPVTTVHYLPGTTGWNSSFAGLPTAPAVAPTISTPPQAQTVAAGSPATFTVVATGTAPLSYQWRKGGTALTGATAAALTLPVVAAADAGTYDVVVTNAVSSVTSTGALLTVTGATSGDFVYSSDGSAATITGYTGAGGAVSIPAALGGFPVTTIGTNAFLGKTTVTSVIFAGTVTAIGPQAFGSCTALTSINLPAGLTSIGQGGFDNCPALLTLHLPASVTSIGSNAFRGNLGMTAITVDAANPAFSSDGKVLFNKTRTSLIKAAIAGVSGVYVVPATVTVIGQHAFRECTGLTGIVLPSGLTTIGGDAFRSCTALGDVIFPASLTSIGGLAFNGTSSLRKAVFLGNAPTFDATFPPFTTVALQVVHYLPGATGWGTTYSGVTTAVMAAPAITNQPQAQSVAAGNPVSFSVTATGTPAPTYQWRKDGTPINGATAATYTIAAVQSADAGSYDVVVTNPAGSTPSGVATLTVTSGSGGPAASLQLVGPAYYLPAGGTFTFQAGITYAGLTPSALGYLIALPDGFSLVSIGGANVPSVAPTPGTTGDLEFAYSTLPANAASFSVVVAYPAGLTGNRTVTAGATYRSPLQSLTIAPLTLTRLDPPAITTQPAGGVHRAGSSLTLTVVATSGVTPTYQWRKGDTPLPGATLASLTFPSLALTDAGTYTVAVTNAAGDTVSAPAQLHVLEVQASHALSGAGYVAGSTVTITNTLTFSPALTSLSWEVLPPAGWTYASGAGTEGNTRPAVGTADLLTWSWSSVPSSPVSFSYTLNVPAGTTGEKTLSALVRPGVAAGALQVLAQPEPLRLLAAAHHSADTNRDLRISLLELTRVIELYNARQGNLRTGAYRVQDTTEDGFASEPAPVAGAALARYHSADTDRNGRLSLYELTRVIELYNTREAGSRTGRYSLLPGSEDGFTPSG